MGENTKIEWTDNSLNLWWGCTEVAIGCDNCYAKTMAKRLAKYDIWGADNPRMQIANWEQNLFRWQRWAEEEDDRRNVFVGSMMDIFEKDMPLISRQGEQVEGLTTDSLRARFFRYLEQEALPNLEFQLLTKRPQNIGKMLPFEILPDNVMIGTSISVDSDVRTHAFPLLEAPFTGRRFLSIEPLLGPIFLPPEVMEGVNWMIVGGESGTKARPMHPKWAKDIVNQCKAWNVPVFFKQWGEWRPVEGALVPTKKTVALHINGESRDTLFPLSERSQWAIMERVGRDIAGARIDGKEIREFPEPIVRNLT